MAGSEWKRPIGGVQITVQQSQTEVKTPLYELAVVGRAAGGQRLASLGHFTSEELLKLAEQIQNEVSVPM